MALTMLKLLLNFFVLLRLLFLHQLFVLQHFFWLPFLGKLKILEAVERAIFLVEGRRPLLVGLGVKIPLPRLLDQLVVIALANDVLVDALLLIRPSLLLPTSICILLSCLPALPCLNIAVVVSLLLPVLITRLRQLTSALNLDAIAIVLD